LNQTGIGFRSRNVISSTYDSSSTSRLGGVLGYAFEIATRWDIVVAATLMALVSFSLPGRKLPDSTSGLDLIALSKFAIRVSVIAWFGSILLMNCLSSLNLRAKQLNQSPWDLFGEFVWSGRWTDRLLFPWWCFAAWSLVTVIWSPRFSVSLGQWLGLVAVLAFTQVISNRYSNTRSFPWQALAIQLSIVFAIYSLMVLIAHTFAPGISGLDRSLFSDDGSNGLFHPTAVGATSSLGLTLVGVLFLQRVTVNNLIVLGMMALHLVVLYLSESRSALAMACVSGVICFVFLMPRVMRASFLLLGGVGLLLMVSLDPGFELASSGISDVSAYVQRGQSADQLRQVSGRAELWELIWKQFKTSPLIGHGYFMTSSTGTLDVWGGTSFEDAHNAVLQVLVSTGIVGGVIFLWALLVSLGHLARSIIAMMTIRISQLKRTNSSNVQSSIGRIPSHLKVEGNFILFTVVVVVWFLGWSQGCVSFLGAIRPEVVAFFGILGLVSAHARWVALESSAHECPLP
jgi:O-antigen ligase